MQTIPRWNRDSVCNTMEDGVSKTLLQQQAPSSQQGCQLSQVDLYTGRKMVV